MNLKDVTTEGLPEEQRKIIGIIGLEAYVKLVDVYGGLSIYITKPDSILRESRNKKIRNEFDGGNYRQLATQYNLSEVSVRLIVAEKDQEMIKSQVNGQIAMD